MTIGQGLSRLERETIITGNAEDRQWIIDTSDPVMARRLLATCKSLGIEPSYPNPSTIRAVLPFAAVRLNKSVRLTDAERERRATAMRERRQMHTNARGSAPKPAQEPRKRRTGRTTPEPQCHEPASSMSQNVRVLDEETEQTPREPCLLCGRPTPVAALDLDMYCPDCRAALYGE